MANFLGLFGMSRRYYFTVAKRLSKNELYRIIPSAKTCIAGTGIVLNNRL
jgi:hypothetical protein